MLCLLMTEEFELMLITSIESMLSSIDCNVDCLLNFMILLACCLSLLLNSSFETEPCSDPPTELESLNKSYSRFTIFNLESRLRRVYDPIELNEVRLLFIFLARALKSSSDSFLDRF